MVSTVKDRLRAKMIENAIEINRLNKRVHETVKRREESQQARQEWSHACEEFFVRYEELCLPGGWDERFFERILSGDEATIEVALCFLEVRPYFFRSGYLWKDILRKCKRAPMSGEQSERFGNFLEKYTEWRKLRNLSSKRGAAVRLDLWPIVKHFYKFFPVHLSDGKFDGVVTVGDLYAILCKALKLEPLDAPDKRNGVVRGPCRAVRQADMSVWAREYRAWKQSVWTPEDIWATLVSIIADVCKPDNSLAISPETILRKTKR